MHDKAENQDPQGQNGQADSPKPPEVIHPHEPIDLFYQAEGHGEMEHLGVGHGLCFAEIKALLIQKHGLRADTLIFLEDADDPLGDHVPIGTHVGNAGVKVHLHRCNHISVTVTFNGRPATHSFGPGTTIARVKHWAASEFGMSPEDAGEHVLQISGTQDQPSSSIHLGTLVTCPACHIAFDLVPEKRIQG
jgi:hypothetical protein